MAASRKVAAAARHHCERPAAGLKPGRPRWRAIAATLLLGAILGGWGARQTMRRREGERAKEQVLLALRIAGTQVARAQREARDHMAH